MRHFVIALAMSAALAACNPQASQDSADATSGGDGPRFYGEQSFTILYEQTGNQSGSWTEHVRDWGDQRVEIKNLTMSMTVPGLPTQTQTQNDRTVYNGDQIININQETGATTITTNPLYANLVAAMGDQDGVEYGQMLMTQMGAQPTGETATVAGHECSYWALAGTRTCITPWGASLRIESNVGPVSIVRTATDVRIGDGGPDEAFAYDADAATQGPDIGALLEKL